MAEYEPGLDVYPVGLLYDLLFFGRTLQRAPAREHVAFAWRKLVRGFRSGWRRRSYWNGYLAEQPNGRARRAGHGWTENRAVEDLAHHLFVELPAERQARPNAAALREQLSDRQIEMLDDVYHQRDTRLPFGDWLPFMQLCRDGYVYEFDGEIGLTPRGVAVLADAGLVEREEQGDDEEGSSK